MVLVPLLAALGAGGLVGCSVSPDASQSHAASLARLSPDEVEGRVGQANFFVFDANPREVFDAGHLPSAVWVPYDGVTAEVLPADKAAALLFYCANEH